MYSEYCYGIEMKRALERHNAGEARIIPIILRPVDWQFAPVGKFRRCPRGANQSFAGLIVTRHSQMWPWEFAK